MDYIISLHIQGSEDLANEIVSATDHPLSLEAIGMYEWDQINPLLAKAAEEMGKVGIDPSQFYS